MAQLAYVHSMAGLDDYVYDGRMRWNLFRKDTDYVWLLFAPHDTELDAMRLLLNYRFDPYEQIARYKPKVISDEPIDV